jgi:8-oxo-dGTP pyrophosphatase MutT (NUDIX family)
MRNNICLIEAHIVKFINNRLFFLLLKRTPEEKFPNVWQPITGHVKKEEKAFATAFRETEEETGFTPEEIFVLPIVNRYYNHEKDEICEIPVFFSVAEKDFNPILSSEHNEFKWADLREAEKLVAWPGQRQSMKIIEEYLTSKTAMLYFGRIKKG